VAITAANHPVGPARRSTRVDRTIPITVMGVDAWRGPYTENVCTMNVSAHGCKYESAHQVLNDSLVILEMKDEQEKAPRSTRGRVKYVKRPGTAGQLFQTAIELEDPGNVWGVDDPPKDWLPFCGPKNVELDTSKPKPFALPRPELATPLTEDKSAKSDNTAKSVKPHEPEAISPSPGPSALAHVAGGLQQQLEQMLSDAASIAVRDRTKATFEELRANLQGEAKRIVAEAIRTNADAAIERSLKQLKMAAQESVQAMHAQWTRQVEDELGQACERIHARGQEMDEVSQALSTSALEKLQRSMETSRRDSVDRIIARLKEQSGPVLSQIQKILAELNQRMQDLPAMVDRSLEESTVRITQAHAQLEKQFDKAIRARMETAQAEFGRSARGASIEALNDLRGLSQKHEAEMRARVQKALEPVVNESLEALRKKATEISQQFAGEIENYSRSHLEFVGGSISELAKGLGKKPRV
jgi:hypothetical protein